MQKIADVLSKYKQKEDKYISREFQKYGYDLAQELGDLKRKAFYIKLAKNENRGILESARTFVKDAVSARNRAALFMWKLRELKSKKGAK